MNFKRKKKQSREKGNLELKKEWTETAISNILKPRHLDVVYYSRCIHLLKYSCL